MTQLTIDGREIEVAPGTMILEAARMAGIEIPTLCARTGIEPYGACRLCLVEINRRGWDDDWTKITASCTLPVEDGLRVETQSRRVREIRTGVIQLLLARCPNVPEIRAMAAKLGATSDARLVDGDPNEKCVLCGLCVRVCADITGERVIDFRHRGIERDVGTPFGAPSDQCLTCGACQSVCPTGAIDLKLFSTHRARPAVSEYDKGLKGRRAIHLPFLQSVPLAPLIDPAMCLQLNKEQCGLCEKACEAGAIDFAQRAADEKIEVGAVVLAPGFCEMDAGRASALGYGRYPNVVTSIEFERILSASGPSGGHVARRSDHAAPRRVAFVQCVGSRNMTERGREYCSAVCCTYAIKQATVAREHDAAIEPAIFVMDVRTHGKDFDKYYERARQSGIRFIRSAVSAIDQIPETGNLLLAHVDGEDRARTEEFDMVVLSVGLQPPRQAAELAQAAGIELGEHGFCATSLTDPLATTRPGVFTCGVFAGPKDIPESVMEASGAAGAAAALLAEARGSRVTPRSEPPERDVRGIEPRIGVFVCHCGINIAGVVEVEDVARYAARQRDVVYAETNLYTCSQDSQERIREMIREHDLNRLVVASCSPRTHEPLFRETAREAGLNRHLVDMANIRDQCSWVHGAEPARATEKAKDLVRMAIARARLAEPLHAQMLPVTQKALVVGGGLAGMTAALSIADAGFDVFLVEKAERLGGNLHRLGRTVEGIEPKELLTDLEKRVREHGRIRVFTQTGIESVDGFVGNFRTTLRPGGDGRTMEIEHGVVILATGANESRPNEYLHGSDERVVTQLEFEAELDEKPDGVPDRIVMIQCVGSREPGHQYCSRVCCAAAVNNALRAKRLNPKAEVYILYRDIRTVGFHERAYREAREHGVVFVRYDEKGKPRVTQVGENGQDTCSRRREEADDQGQDTVGSKPEATTDAHATTPADNHGQDARACSRRREEADNHGQDARARSRRREEADNHGQDTVGSKPEATTDAHATTPADNHGQDAHSPSRRREEADDHGQDTVGSKPEATTDAHATTLRVEVFDPVLGRDLVLEADRLVLSARIDATADNETLAQLFKVPLNEDGFFLEAHVKLRPVDFATDGVFVAGLAHGPKGIRSAIAQARAAAGRALTILTRTECEAPATVAFVFANRCTGCGQCEGLCAYGAIAVDPEQAAAVVNEALCKGCGACAASCRSNAITVRGASDPQIWSMIEAFVASK